MGTMTKKDFIAIAKAINEEVQRAKRCASPEGQHDAATALVNVAEEIAHVCARSNKLFDYNRFFVACGVRRGSSPSLRKAPAADIIHRPMNSLALMAVAPFTSSATRLMERRKLLRSAHLRPLHGTCGAARGFMSFAARGN